MILFLKGTIIGFSIAAPVGPIGLLCIQKTLKYGKLNGFITGTGAASADAAYGLIAALGLSAITNFMIGQQNWLSLFGGLFLCYLGGKIIGQKSATNSLESSESSLLKSYITTFLLTITNPMTILSFIAVFASINNTSQHNSILNNILMVSGVFSGSLMWWFILSNFANLFKDKIDLKWINKISGIVIMLFGFVAILKLLIK